MKYTFGPVPSRRLGRSLGIDTLPLKTCNWNCVYCQLGRTLPLTNERREYVPAEEILREAGQALQSLAQEQVDWVTFVGSGEPTLHSKLGWLIRRIKGLTEKPIAVITNGSLLYLPEVRAELSAADAILPTLDAGTAGLYRRINRPHPQVTLERLVDGLVAFRSEYRGKLWVEVMLVHGLNDSEPALRRIAQILRRIHPDEVHVNLPTRSPAETWVQLPDQEGLARALSILGKIARVVHPAEGNFDVSRGENALDAIVEIITRHPMRQAEVEQTLNRWSPERAGQALAELKAGGRVQIVERGGDHFWSAAPCRYPDDAHSRRTIPSDAEFPKKGDV
ncbi:MAG TPA: radical SAM protein [Anaerolineales bacterium]|nr:radical SAM protein [Anaerolineales bacterium]